MCAEVDISRELSVDELNFIFQITMGIVVCSVHHARVLLCFDQLFSQCCVHSGDYLLYCHHLRPINE